MANQQVVFRRVKGRLVPIRATKGGTALVAKGAVVAAGAGAALRIKKNKALEPNKAWLAAGYGLNIASGVLGGLTWYTKGWKKIGGAIGAGIALDTASYASFGRAYKGVGGTTKERLKQAARHVGKAELASHITMGAVTLAHPRTRAFLRATGSQALKLGARAFKYLR